MAPARTRRIRLRRRAAARAPRATQRSREPRSRRRPAAHASARATLGAATAPRIAAVLATRCQNTELTPEARNLAAVRDAGAVPGQPRARAARREPADARTAGSKRRPKVTAANSSRRTTSRTSRPSGETPVDRIRATGYIPGPNVGYVIGENLAWGTYDAGHAAGDRRRLDRLAGPPREHPRIAVHAKPASASRPAVPASLGDGAPGATYAQEFGVIIALRRRPPPRPHVVHRSLLWPDQRKEVVLTLSDSSCGTLEVTGR